MAASTPKTDKSGGGGGGAGRAGNRLARRARSFKEDLLDILCQMRSAGNANSSGVGTGVSSGGVSPAPSVSSSSSPRPPRSPKPRNVSTSDVPYTSTSDDRSPLTDLDLHVKQVQLALKHFNDVVSKNKLEVLPGNGTIVLESIATIQGVLKTYVFIDQSSALMSATNQVYQSLTLLIKLCDDVLISGEKGLNRQNVTDVLSQVDDAVQNLLGVVRAKLADESSSKTCGSSIISKRGCDLVDSSSLVDSVRSGLRGGPLGNMGSRWNDLTGNSTSLRASLPDITTMSSESTPPPAKPPLPSMKVLLGDSPPPLPPKKKPVSVLPSGPGVGCGVSSLSMERLSLRSDNSSLGSLDSMLNTSSKDEEELRAIMDDDSVKHDMVCLRTSSLVNGSQSGSCCWDNSSCSKASDVTHLTESPDPMQSANNMFGGVVERSSMSSGFVSLQQSTSSHQSGTAFNCTSSTTTTSMASEERRFTSRSCSTFASVSSESSMTSLVSHSALTERRSSGISLAHADSVPPLPEKKRSRRERQPSQYDNVPHTTTSLSSSPTDSSNPPPLPLKKKHIMAYMEMFGNCSQPNANEPLRHSMHTYSLLQAEWQQHQASLSSAHSCSFTSHSFSTSHSHSSLGGEDSLNISGEFLNNDCHFPNIIDPPALPPKRSRVKSSSVSPPPPVPHALLPPPPPPPSSATTPTPPSPLPIMPSSPTVPPSLSPHPPSPVPPFYPPSKDASSPLVPASKSPLPLTNGTPSPSVPAEPNILFELDVSKYLVMMRPEDGEGVAIRGGHIDALIIHATKASKNIEEKEADFLYQEAFLTTYRTFLSPLNLIEKLCARQRRFSGSSDPAKQRAAREAFSLLVRAVSDLTVSDLEDSVIKALMEFVYGLISAGDLTMGRVLRVVILEKYSIKIHHLNACTLLPSQNIYTRQSSLTEFKSEQVAEQMTLLDSELFMKIEIPEVLVWAQEQNEERSPNLTRFTEHFNKMSYWARSRILEQNEAKERERFVVKFIKIMKHLRKINNFNSYLALLSALDSAPIRRLEWQKHITEGLKEYCALIDSSSSFRAYRQALAETQPPCIPYIGLVLQDLTFVHIGNSDYLSEGVINFSKRWQQFNIVENMKRFKKGTYNFKKNERIIAFFSNFDDFLCEEAMWQISESIKPRGSKKSNQ